jgi:hypothetical protein
MNVIFVPEGKFAFVEASPAVSELTSEAGIRVVVSTVMPAPLPLA